MHPSEPSRRGLKLLCWACLLLLPACLAAFAVNLERALGVFVPGALWLETYLPAPLFGWLAAVSLDLSTISTAVPVLMLAFPLVQGLRVLGRPAGDRAFLRNLAAVPYPAHFAFFLVMLGLVGTLYGLWIGLRVSGVAALAGAAPSAEPIQTALDRLMGGTATAILSSLVGIIAAFFAARPIPWLFRRLIGLEEEESRRTLSETIEQLTHDLVGLGEASRGLTALLGAGAGPGLAGRLEALEAVIQGLNATCGRVLETLEALSAAQAEGVAQLRRLETIEALLRERAAQGAAARPLLERAAEAGARGAESLGALSAAAERRQAALEARLDDLAAMARALAEERHAGRNALARALAEFIK